MPEPTTDLAVSTGTELATLNTLRLQAAAQQQEELAEESQRLPSYTWNANKTDADGSPISKKLFVHSATGETTPTLRGFLVGVKVGKLFSTFEATREPAFQVYCSSDDGKFGVPTSASPVQFFPRAPGEETPPKRKCSECSFQNWSNSGRGVQPTKIEKQAWNGRKGPPCSPVWTLVFRDAETSELFTLHCKSTSRSAVSDWFDKVCKGKGTKDSRGLPTTRYIGEMLVTLSLTVNPKPAPHAVPCIKVERDATLEEFQANLAAMEYAKPFLKRHADILEAETADGDVVAEFRVSADETPF